MALTVKGGLVIGLAIFIVCCVLIICIMCCVFHACQKKRKAKRERERAERKQAQIGVRGPSPVAMARGETNPLDQLGGSPNTNTVGSPNPPFSPASTRVTVTQVMEDELPRPKTREQEEEEEREAIRKVLVQLEAHPQMKEEIANHLAQSGSRTEPPVLPTDLAVQQSQAANVTVLKELEEYIQEKKARKARRDQRRRRRRPRSCSSSSTGSSRSESELYTSATDVSAVSPRSNAAHHRGKPPNGRLVTPTMDIIDQIAQRRAAQLSMADSAEHSGQRMSVCSAESDLEVLLAKKRREIAARQGRATGASQELTPSSAARVQKFIDESAPPGEAAKMATTPRDTLLRLQWENQQLASRVAFLDAQARAQGVPPMVNGPSQNTPVEFALTQLQGENERLRRELASRG